MTARGKTRRDGWTPKQAALVKRLVKSIHSSPAWRTVYSSDRSLYESMLASRYQKRDGSGPAASSKDLSIDDLTDLNALMWGKRVRPIRKAPAVPPAGKREGSRSKNKVAATVREGQWNKINMLRGLIRWELEDGFHRWCEKRFGFRAPKTDRDAWKVIEGLKAMFENQMNAEFGPDWATLPNHDFGVRRYIKIHMGGEG